MKKITTILLILSCAYTTFAQSSISFQHLNTSNGLSYGGVNDICVDKGGNLWIATGNGLNVFNGRTVTKYYVADYPQLGSNNFMQVVCDENNRVWVMTDKQNITMFDEQRHLHKIKLPQSNAPGKTQRMLFTKSEGVIFFTGKAQYSLNQNFHLGSNDSLGLENFSICTIAGFDTLQSKRYKHIFKYDEDRYFFSQDTMLYVVNYQTKRVERKCHILYGNLLVKWDDESVLLCDLHDRKLKVFNINTGVTTLLNEGLKDQFGNAPNDYFVYAKKLNRDQYLLTALKTGAYIYNKKTKELYNYRHNPSDATSIGNNRVMRIAYGNNGWAFVVTVPNGISYFNTRETIGSREIFQDAAGKVYDGYINCVATEDNNKYYLGTNSGLIEWKRNTNTSSFLDFKNAEGTSLLTNEEVQILAFDSKGKLWVSTISKGLLVLNRNMKMIKYFRNNGNGVNSLKMRRAYSLQEDKNGYMWAGGENGICRFNINTLAIDTFANTALAKLDKIFVSPIFFSDADNVWIGLTDQGVLNYNLVTKKQTEYNKNNGLMSNYIFAINKDNDNNIYIGSDSGVNLLMHDGSRRTITTKDGLLIARAEALVADKNGRMWIGNDIGLACYSASENKLSVFDERYGLSIYGFRVNAYYQNGAGEFVFGTPKGLQYFYPNDLLNKKINLNAVISSIETKDTSSGITRSASFDLASDDNYVTFYFNTVDFSSHQNTFYKYKLEGSDKDWLVVTNQNSVHYSSLQPGKYVFKLKVSSNKKDWHDAVNEVTITIAVPFWKTWWFRVLGIIGAASLLVYVINFYRQKQKRKEGELETELVITYFASQINKHTNTDELLWDVAKNCISQLHFEDCVIYQLDKERNMLIQKAAYGPKNRVDFTIHQPIEIRVGEGIVGSVAKTGKAEIIHNTALDNRYIVDDKRRNSEITIPIIIDGKAVGVIDSEHPRKNFFNNRHLKILNTIAALCASQMQLVKAEEQKKKAEIELLQNKQKALESRLQSLRLQMNPHFLFNALNSVQQMILANEEMIATRYLSRFSKLLRAILVHSDRETITLKEELEILNLYVELESIRFKGTFSYKIICDETIDTDEVKIPTLLIQPFVENAIWHGLMHKEGERNLVISFTEKEEWLTCVVEDNGVGRHKAKEIKGISPNGTTHQSKGIAVSTERLKAMKTRTGVEGNISFTDLEDSNGDATGTNVKINFPIQT